jgi:hypothetical protein
VYLCTEIFQRLDEHQELFVGYQRHQEIASNLQKVLKPYHVKVNVKTDNTLDKTDLAVGGEFYYDRTYQPIHLHLHFPPKAHGKFQWKGKWEHFRFLVAQVLQHELIHQHQCQFPDHLDGNYYDMNIDNKDINYFSELDEIDAFGHDIAMEIRYYYPNENPYQVLKTVSRRKYIYSYKYYTRTFKGLDWNKIRHRLIKKANNWLPYTHI